jgi:hypothetical protein
LSSGARAQLDLQLDVKRVGETWGSPARIEWPRSELYLSLNPAKQFDARALTVRSRIWN